MQRPTTKVSSATGAKLEDPKLYSLGCALSTSVGSYSQTSPNCSIRVCPQMGLKTPTKKWILNHLPLKEFDDTCSEISFLCLCFIFLKMSKYKYCFPSYHIWEVNQGSLINFNPWSWTVWYNTWIRNLGFDSSCMALGMLLNFSELFFFFFFSKPYSIVPGLH